MLYDFMGVVTLLVCVVAAVVVGISAGLLWLFGQWLWTRHSRKRELRASDLRGDGGAWGHGPYSVSPYSDAELAEMHDNRGDSPRVLRNSDLLAKRWTWHAGQLAPTEDLLRQVDEKVAANPPGAVISVTKAEMEAIRKAPANYWPVWPEPGAGSPDGMAGAPMASDGEHPPGGYKWPEPVSLLDAVLTSATAARDPFAAWDGKRFVPVADAPQVPANPMFDWLPDRDIAVRWLEAHRDAQKADSKWRGTGGARSDMPQEWVDRVTEAGLVATNPVDVRRQAAEAGIRFNSQTGRGERIRETGPEAKWVP